jgi:hypothetical protein
VLLDFFGFQSSGRAIAENAAANVYGAAELETGYA